MENANNLANMTSSQEPRKVPKSLLWKCFFKFAFFHHCSQSFDRGYVNSFTNAIAPIFRYLYEGRPDADEQIRAGLMRTRNYYLCEQSFSTIVFAIIIGMEEQKANGAEIDGDLIVATRASMMGPLSGLGDAINGSTLRQIAIAITLPYCLEGSVFGAFMMMAGMSLAPCLIALLGYPRGYRLGNEFVLKLLQNGIMQKVADAAGIMAMFIMGGMSSKFVSITTSLVFQNKYKEINIQEMIDSAIPGILTIGAVFIYYWLLKKKVKISHLTIGTMVLGIILSVFKIMGH
ncbi:PTS system mannose/fructose/sorbose family transporter subunit IID [Enterococcus pallens]|uniref:PTS system mannose/fructose/sorbose-specific IID component n=1 Tax=Enterococcus pallens ATCC BAA-351 TaxID=1158607 RepID=R2QGC6_9ENTE|nr:PTS system mannose/fructose/sorbose family transporter subunit IID [Enterococcus pallens]EOH95562.1 hypothetical protein UAU_01524 [Enterococcus pallens ATCC BAA-351]EOU21301.1 hypothetical protein I588_02148 [Enterococcus pallens ATCC BAA-351]OJG78810.1 hypothetical protein RV10_GL001296 [Enterococcus pallens]